MKLKKDKQINYLLKLSDEVGLIEHATRDEPNYKEGWCVDDNARAIQVCLAFPENKQLNQKLSTYVSFIKSAWREGKLFNDFNEDLTWKDDATTDGEHIGRALAAFGELINKRKDFENIKGLADKIYKEIKNKKIRWPRVTAQLVLGGKYLYPEDIKKWADKLVKIYRQVNDNNWKWFESKISYDNGRIPMALLTAFEITGDKKYLKIATESLDFLTDLFWDEDKQCLSFPGNKGWIEKDGIRAKFDQQPVEAGSMVEAYNLAYKITDNKKYKKLAKIAFEWYEGRNIRKQKMINEVSGGIYDGFGKKEVNQNQGAEAVLSYLLAVSKVESI